MLLKWIGQYVVAKSGDRYYKAFNNFLLHVSSRVLKDMYILNYEIINNINSL